MLNGLSQPGSWPTQTPFLTSAMTVQPTEQCVQTDLTRVAPALSGPTAAASALRTAPGSMLAAATPPATRPDRARNLRRSTAVPATVASPCIKRVVLAVPLDFFVSMSSS